MTSRRVRGPAAHRAADRAAACKTLSVCGMLSRALRWRAPTGGGRTRGAMGTSRLPAKPHGRGRTMPSRAPRRWRGGAMGTSRPTATGPDNGARQRDRTTGDGNGARNAARCQAEHRAVVWKERETEGRFCRLPSNRDTKILSCFPRSVLITLPPISIYPFPRRIQPPLFQWSVHPRTRKPETIRYG